MRSPDVNPWNKLCQVTFPPIRGPLKRDDSTAAFWPSDLSGSRENSHRATIPAWRCNAAAAPVGSGSRMGAGTCYVRRVSSELRVKSPLIRTGGKRRFWKYSSTPDHDCCGVGRDLRRGRCLITPDYRRATVGRDLQR
jgi:hypothetical protein